MRGRTSSTWKPAINAFYDLSTDRRPASKDAFGIPHDLKILDEVFRCPDGSYSAKNHYWSSWWLQDLIAGTTPEQQACGANRDRRIGGSAA
jgi:hypothetical protein